MNKIDARDNWFPSVDRAIASGDIRAFGTRRQAEEAAQLYGWGNRVIRCERRCENVWLVGVVDFQPEEVAGITKDVFRVPLLRYNEGEGGVKYQPVVKFYLPRNAPL